MVKRLLTRIVYPPGRRSGFVPSHSDRARELPSRLPPRRVLDAFEPTPNTALLSAEEAKDRLREIVKGFFFRRLRTEDGKRVGRDTAAPFGLRPGTSATFKSRRKLK